MPSGENLKILIASRKGLPLSVFTANLRITGQPRAWHRLEPRLDAGACLKSAAAASQNYETRAHREKLCSQEETFVV